jgi:hypothetical protein
MKNQSYLVVLDSSAQSRACAAFAWNLAAETGARVVGHHVVDAPAVWRFLSFEKTGFVGSGVFMEARERIIAVLHSIADALVLSYESLAEGRGVIAETVIDEGDTVTEISQRSKEHDLIICGATAEATDQPQLFERLAQVCYCPILIIKGYQKPWSKLQVLATAQSALSSYDSILCPIVKTLGLRMELRTEEELLASEDVKNLRSGTFDDEVKPISDDVLLIVPALAVAEDNFDRDLRIVKHSAFRSEFYNAPVGDDFMRTDLEDIKSRFAS